MIVSPCIYLDDPPDNFPIIPIPPPLSPSTAITTRIFNYHPVTSNLVHPFYNLYDLRFPSTLPLLQPPTRIFLYSTTSPTAVHFSRRFYQLDDAHFLPLCNHPFTLSTAKKLHLTRSIQQLPFQTTYLFYQSGDNDAHF